MKIDEKKITDSDIVTFGIGILCFVVGITLLSKNNPVPDSKYLLCASIFALAFGVSLTLPSNNFKYIAMLSCFIFSYPLTNWLLSSDMIIQNLNNAFSFFALGYSIIFLPISHRREEKKEKEIQHLQEQITEKDNTILNHDREKNDQLKKVKTEYNARFSETLKEKDSLIKEIKENSSYQISNLKETIEKQKLNFENEIEELRSDNMKNSLTIHRQHKDEIDLWKDKVKHLEKKLNESKISNKKLEREITKTKSKTPKEFIESLENKRELVNLTEERINNVSRLLNKNIKDTRFSFLTKSVEDTKLGPFLNLLGENNSKSLPLVEQNQKNFPLAKYLKKDY